MTRVLRNESSVCVRIGASALDNAAAHLKLWTDLTDRSNKLSQMGIIDDHCLYAFIGTQ